MVFNKKSGYTLIEMIVVLGIASIVFGISMASFDIFNETKKLDEEGEVFKSNMEEIFKKASSGDLNGDVGCIVGGASVSNKCDSYKYIFKIPTNNFYSLDFYCDCPGSEVPDTVTQSVYSHTLPAIDKVTMSSALSSYTFERGTVTSGCVNLVRNARVNAVYFNFPGNVNVNVGSSCP